MIYSRSEDVPRSWEGIIGAFICSVEHDVDSNKGVPINNLQFGVKRGLLSVNYCGGSKITDAFAFFAREMSGTICYECGAPNTRTTFGTPKCDDCD